MATNSGGIIGLLDQLINAGYDQTAGQVINAIITNSDSGLIGQRLNELQSEAARLVSAGEKLTADNPVVRALLADLETTLRDDAGLIRAIAPQLQAQGANAAGILTKQLSLLGVSETQLSTFGVQWNVPDPEQINALVQYVGGDAFNAELERYQSGILDQVRNTVLNGQIAGRGSLAIAQDVLRAVQDTPASWARQITRSLQLTAWRDAAVLHQLANADILEPYVIRIATLDTQTCLACVNEHGARLPLGTRVDDHRQGRCASVAPLRGRPINIQTGQQWFDGLSDADQLALMGAANYNAYKAGAVQLPDFVRHVEDDVFGPAIVEASLKGILGDQAQRYYARNQ